MAIELHAQVWGPTAARLRIGTMVLNNDLRHPVVLAREAAGLADLSGGRFELGLGAGYMRAEYDRAGLRFEGARVRVARLCESVQVLRGLLAGETVSWSGEHYTVREERLDPAPAARVPILIGGNGRRTQTCAARHADALGLTGFSPRRDGTDIDASSITCAGLDAQVARLRELTADRAEPLQLQALVQSVELTTHRDAALERVASALELPLEWVADSPYVLAGTADEIATTLREHHERFGITRWTLFVDKPGAPSIEELAAVAERVR
jgi:probable F420-dependent oxidoreductase